MNGMSRRMRKNSMSNPFSSPEEFGGGRMCARRT
jgi:hypothetical protein